MKNENKQTGRVNYVWVLAGGYLVYLAVQMLFGLLRGKSETPMVALIGGVVFIAIGGWVLLREWRAYKFGLEHKDDPETWSDEPMLEEPVIKDITADEEEGL